MLRILPLLCLFLGTQTAQADILQGRVLDAETREPLDGAKVSIEEVIPDVCTFNQVFQTDSLGRFQYRCSGMTRITIRADFFGYKQGFVRLVGSDGGDTIRIDDILLKRVPNGGRRPTAGLGSETAGRQYQGRPLAMER